MAQLGSAGLSLAHLGSALLCFCFTLLLSGILSPNLAHFSPKPFGHVLCSFQMPKVSIRDNSEESE